MPSLDYILTYIRVYVRKKQLHDAEGHSATWKIKLVCKYYNEEVSKGGLISESFSLQLKSQKKVLKVSKFRKQIMMSWILPKNGSSFFYIGV
jgi:hypothetical protein